MSTCIVCFLSIQLTWPALPLPPGALAGVHFKVADHGEGALVTALAHHSAHVALAAPDGSVHLFGQDGSEAGKPLLHKSSITALAFSPAGKLLATADGAKCIHLWDWSTAREKHRLQGHEDEVDTLAFSPDGKLLATAGRDKAVRLWDVSTGKEVRKLTGHRGRILVVAFSPNGELLASGGTDLKIHVRNLKTGRDLRPANAQYGWVLALAFSPDGTKLASAGRDQTVHLWDVVSGRRLAQIDGYDGPITALAMTHDGRTIAAATEDKNVRLWEAATGKERRRFGGHKGRVSAVRFVAKDQKLLSLDDHGALYTWDVTGQAKTAGSAALDRPALLRYWDDLASADAELAYRAVWTFRLAGQSSVPFLREQFQPLLSFSSHVKKLLTDLDSQQFAVRDHAHRELQKTGTMAIPLLRERMEDKPTLEVRQRLKFLLNHLTADEGPSFSEEWRILRVIEILEALDGPEARRLLTAIAEKGPSPDCQNEAAMTLTRLR